MRRQIAFTSLVACVALTALATKAWAQAGLWKIKAGIEQSIEDKLRPAIALYDPDAVISVQTHFKKQAYELPGTPFTYHTLNVSDGANSDITQIDVTIFTRRLPIPDQLQSLLKSVIRGYAPRVHILAQSLPKEILQTAPKSMLSTKSDSTQNQYTLWIALAGCLVLSGFILLGNSVLNRRHFQKVLENVGGKIQDAMDHSDASSHSTGAQLVNETGGKEEQLSKPTTDYMNSTHQVDLGKDGLRALLWDCYWTHRDAYASFIWSAISFEERQELLTESPRLVQYVRYLSQIPAENLGLHNDPAYIQPMPLDHLNQESLTKWVKSHPQLITSLSRLRQESLQLSAVERISILSHSSDVDTKTDFSELKSLPGSQPRQLEKQVSIHLENLKEERDILAMKSLSVRERKGIPSLGWLLELPNDVISGILDSYSARDLASAWIAPEEVLSSLEKALSPKKVALIHEFLTTMTPNRRSAVYQAIHSETINQLVKYANSQTHELEHESERSAA